ncbi:MAG: hypothetical protein QOJ98_1418, partial [Acidobacteriota bacterium]|nr:hypothetical protein [Acidobacteriota bacterium]
MSPDRPYRLNHNLTLGGIAAAVAILLVAALFGFGVRGGIATAIAGLA